MNVKQLYAAVDCCTRDGNWESTCGKCPFRIRDEETTNEPLHYCTGCIDNLILALAEYLPVEGDNDEVPVPKKTVEYFDYGISGKNLQSATKTETFLDCDTHHCMAYKLGKCLMLKGNEKE